MKRTGLRAKLVRVFAIQMLMISVATLLGIWITNSIVKDVLMRGALDGEAAHYWSLYRADPTQPLPNTDNMRGYLSVDGDSSAVPDGIAEQAPGYHHVIVSGADKIVHVSDEGNARLFLVFDSDRVFDLAFYFGILPLSLVLLVMYGLMFFAYRLSQRAISPIVRLARNLESFDFERDRSIRLDLDALRDHGDAEVMAMIDAVEGFTSRLDAFVERERVFTRDASHELRTPVAVFKGTLDLLEKNGDRPKHDLDALRRMRRTVEDMEGLLETLLLLAREDDMQLPAEEINVNELVAEQLDVLQPLAKAMGNTVRLREAGELRVRAPTRVVQVLLNNLIRNAINYTQAGNVDVVITPTSVRVVDTGVGMSAEELAQAFEPFYRGNKGRGLSKGHGLGLAIVKRLVHRFNWTITAESGPDEGTAMEVSFSPAAG
jgi:signal transduction histidine kinase